MLLGGLLFVLIETERTGRLPEVVIKDCLLVDEVVRGLVASKLW